MEDIGRMHGFQGSKGLIYKVLTMVIGEVLCANNSMHIGFHQLLNQIDVGELV
jgi:hypothetical protein